MDGSSTQGTRNVRPMLFLVGTAIILISAVIFFIFNAVVWVNISGAPSGASVDTAGIFDDSTKKIGGSGFVIVPRTAHNLVVSAGDNIKTIINADLPWYGLSIKSVQLTPDKNADKVAYAGINSLCATYNPGSELPLYYDCAKPTGLFTYDTPTDTAWTNKKVADLKYIDDQLLPPYQGGVIGIAKDNNSKGSLNEGDASVSVVATNIYRTQSYEAPSDITTSNLAGLRLFTNAASADDGRFVIVDSFGVAYLATPGTGDGVISYKRVSAPGDYSYKFNQTVCSFHKDNVYCLRGRNAASAESGATVTATSIDVLSFDTGIVKTISVNGVSKVNGFYITDGQMYVRSDQSLYRLDKTTDTAYSARRLVQGAASIASADKLYFTNGNGVYAMDDNTGDAHQVFYSGNIGVMGIYPVDGKVFIFGLAKNGGSTVFAYQLNANDNTAPGKRLIDVLPLPPTSIADVLADDFVGNKLYLKITKDAQNGDDVRDNFLNTLNTRGGATIDKDDVVVVRNQT